MRLILPVLLLVGALLAQPLAPPGLRYKGKTGKERAAQSKVDSLHLVLKDSVGTPNEASVRAKIRKFQTTIDSCQSSEWVQIVADSIAADSVLTGKVVVSLQKQTGGHQVKLDFSACSMAERDSMAAFIARQPVPMDWNHPVYKWGTANGPGFARYTMPVLRAAVVAANEK